MNLPDITSDINKMQEKKIKTRQINSNRASMLDDPCTRKLVYYRTRAKDAKPVPLSLQGIFDTGNELEPVIEQILAKAGMAANPRWRLVGKEDELEGSLFRKHNITGHIDGKLQVYNDAKDEWENMAVPDIKTCNPHIWENLNTYEDLDRYFWTKKYRGQLMLYCLGMELEKACLILVNKTNIFQIKTIWFDLDYGYADTLINKAELVNTHVKAGTLPPKLNQPDECSRCQFAAVCMPELESTGNMELVDNNEIEELLQRREELEPAKKEHAAVERQLDKLWIKGQDMICGDYLVQWKKGERHYKAAAAKVVETWTKKISCTKAEETEAVA